MSRSNGLRLFLMLCVGCVLAILFAGIVAVRQRRNSSVVSSETAAAVMADRGLPARNPRAQLPANQPDAKPSSEEPALAKPEKALRTAAEDAHAKAAPKPKPRRNLLYFRRDASSDVLGKLAVTSVDALDQVRYSKELSCARVYFTGGVGVCVTRTAPNKETGGPGGLDFLSGLTPFAGFSAVAFNDQLHPVGPNVQLNGLPSRVRVSPSGHLAAVTVFLSGQSYAALKFSTQTTIIDVRSGKVLADVEMFAVTRNGEPFKSPDFNFWGVTFSRDENIFYATLWSLGKTYLVKCNLRNRTAEVIYDWVECPSLSPDNTRIAFKKRMGFVGGPAIWRISLLDLKTFTVRALGETRSVDDQVEWLDNEQILYALSEDHAGANIWALPVDPTGSPRLLMTSASSPAVVRIPN